MKTPEKNPVGRPRKPANSRRSEELRAKGTPHEAALAAAVAAKRELTMTDLIHDLVAREAKRIGVKIQ